MSDQTTNDTLWTHRSVEDTQEVYAKWADSYDADVTGMAYATPDRIAQALLYQFDDLKAPILDFGCGTGLSGLALARHGFSLIDGTDISAPMLTQATAKTHQGQPVYRRLWHGTPGAVDVPPGTYPVIIATGVISLGAAPPTLLAGLLNALAPGGLLAFSYNDPTLQDAAYLQALNAPLKDGTAEQVFREHGPHLSEKVTGSDVIVLKRR